MFDRKEYMKKYYQENKKVFLENAKRQNRNGYKQKYYQNNADRLKIIAQINRKTKDLRISTSLKNTIISITIADKHYDFNYKPSIFN